MALRAAVVAAGRRLATRGLIAAGEGNLSVRLANGSAKEVARRMWQAHGVIADSREPDVIRLAPAPLYVSYHDSPENPMGDGLDGTWHLLKP